MNARKEAKFRKILEDERGRNLIKAMKPISRMYYAATAFFTVGGLYLLLFPFYDLSYHVTFGDNFLNNYYRSEKYKKKRLDYMTFELPDWLRGKEADL